MKKNLIFEFKKEKIKIFYFNEKGEIKNIELDLKREENKSDIIFSIPNILKNNAIKKIPAHIVLNEENEFLGYQIKKFPKLPRTNLEKAIEFEIKRYFKTETIFDYKILTKTKEGTVEDFLILFVFVNKDRLDEIIEKFKKINIRILSITFPFANTFLTCKDNIKGSTLIVNIGEYCTNFIFVKDGDLLYAKKEDIGGVDFDISISKGLDLEIEKAKEMKEKEIVFSPEKKEFYILRQPFEAIIKSINNSILLFRNFYPNETIEKIYFVGGGIKLKGLIENIKENLSLPCELLDININNTKIPLELFDIYSLNYQPPFFNLIERIPYKLNKKVLVGFFIFFLIYFLSLTSISKILEKRINSKEIKTHINYEKILEQKYPYSEVLLKLGIYIPEDIFINEITFEKENFYLIGTAKFDLSLDIFYISLLKSGNFKVLTMDEKKKQEESIFFKIKGIFKDEI